MYKTKLLAAAVALAITGGLAVAQTSAPAVPSAAPAGVADGPASPRSPDRGHAHGHDKRSHMLRHLDTDGDGHLSRAEMQAMHAQQLQGFDAADVNRDGKLDAGEQRAMRDTMRETMRGRTGVHGAHGRHGRHGAPSGTPPAPAAQPQG